MPVDDFDDLDYVALDALYYLPLDDLNYLPLNDCVLTLALSGNRQPEGK